MPQPPESLVEMKEYCSNCGRVLGVGSTYVRATIEQITSDEGAILIDTDKRHFCTECLKAGICISVKDPESG